MHFRHSYKKFIPPAVMNKGDFQICRLLQELLVMRVEVHFKSLQKVIRDTGKCMSVDLNHLYWVRSDHQNCFLELPYTNSCNFDGELGSEHELNASNLRSDHVQKLKSFYFFSLFAFHIKVKAFRIVTLSIPDTYLG